MSVHLGAHASYVDVIYFFLPQIKYRLTMHLVNETVKSLDRLCHGCILEMNGTSAVQWINANNILEITHST